MSQFKCRMCRECNGLGCKGQLPGMGGVNNSWNFIKNCLAWKEDFKNLSEKDRKTVESISVEEKTGIGPVTGAMQNIGFAEEKDFYLPYFKLAQSKGFFLCAGDGAPDEKLKFGVAAVKELNEKAYFFLKPYPDENLFKRIELVKDYALGIGMDIDAYNIVTMRNQVHLEKKSVEQCLNLKKICNDYGLPFMLKGIFTKEDVELCKAVKPEICVISNHGGRVETEKGSTLDFLKNYGKDLNDSCGQVWIDGGIRNKTDVQLAVFYGADKVLTARPVIAELLKNITQK